jgi:hypothetical protein
MLVRYGSCNEFIKRCEKVSWIDGADLPAIKAEVGASGRCLFLLSQQGNLFAVSTQNFEVLAVLAPERPFTLISADRSAQVRFLTAEGDDYIFDCKLEGY